MSDLITNLTYILNVKTQIKEVIDTESDDFETYPSLIEAAIQGGGSVSGYSYIIANGDYDVSTYAYASVNVPVPSGYIIPTGTKSISSNGNGIDISSYASVDVNVPVPSGYIIPTGTKSISSNGNGIDITSYASVDVNVPVPSGYIIPSGTKLITSNDNGIDITSYASVDVYVPVPSGYIIPSGTYNITSNGTVNVSSYENAYVNVSGGTPSLNGTYYLFYEMMPGAGGASIGTLDIASMNYPAYVSVIEYSAVNGPEMGGMDWSYYKLAAYTYSGGVETRVEAYDADYNNLAFSTYNYGANVVNLVFYQEEYQWMEDPEMGDPTMGWWENIGSTKVSFNGNTILPNVTGSVQFALLASGPEFFNTTTHQEISSSFVSNV